MLPENIFKIDEFLWNTRWDKGPPIRRIAIGFLRHLYALIRDLMAGQLNLRAMSLVYSTLLSVVPLIALSFSLLKGFGVHYRLETLLADFVAPLGPQGEQLLSDVVGFVENVRGGVLASTGLAFLLYTVISMIQKVEESFNYVWQVNTPRSFARRFSEYLSVLLVGPALMVTALTLIGSMANNDLVVRLAEIQPFGHAIILIGKLMPYVVVVFVFSFVYVFIPNTKVNLSAALVGGLTSGVLWATVGAFFAAFVANSARTWGIYGGFAIVIVTLIWLYLNWLILLIGAQLSYYWQHPESLELGRTERRLPNQTRESLALSVMVMVARDFIEGKEGWNVVDLGAYLGVPSVDFCHLMKSLEDANLIRLTEDEHLIPGRALDHIKLQDVLLAVRGAGLPGISTSAKTTGPLQPVLHVVDNVDQAIKGALGDTTLKDLAERAPA